MFFHDKPLEPEDFFKLLPKTGTGAVIETAAPLKNFGAAHFDWVYLHTGSEEQTAAALDLLRDRVKPGGLITGTRFDAMAGAIEIFCTGSPWKMVYVDDWDQWCLMHAGN